MGIPTKLQITLTPKKVKRLKKLIDRAEMFEMPTAEMQTFIDDLREQIALFEVLRDG